MMKLSTKIILPILLISALLILLTGCFLVPPKEEPGYTSGTVTGTMARPMVCREDPEGELIGDPISSNICDELCIPFNTVDWYAWANVQVVLNTWVDSEEVELATTVTDANGDYIFTDVPPDINYIITANCPNDEEFVIKDVVEELVEGETYDAGIADAESTVLALCLDGLGEIGVNSELIDLGDSRSHDYYNEVIEEVCGYLADCDHAIPLWVCVLTELCPGYTTTPEYTPTPSPDTYTLTMAADPVGGGTTSPAVGAHTYSSGTVVDITATPASGYQFVDWTGDVADPNSVSTTVTMNADKTTVVNFAPTPSNTMHVSNIEMSLKTAGINVNAIAIVTIVDSGGNPVEGSTVSGHWSETTTDSDSGITDANGEVSLESNKVKNPSSGTTFTFTVDNVTKDGWTYNSSANTETSDSISVP